ncbi:MOSC N-terminal beta barrel domain-containing protein [Saccharopolyspora sp. NPDC050389]|uniref:MOSC domain-containing protein n=1 Tax=Saccharopolyspora sp. NPDC050389 TaxID=3155516 RepID=UPI0033C4C623
MFTAPGEIAALISYPVKGCAGVATSGSTLTPAGLEHDRAFMVVDLDGTYRTQRKHPRLALVQPHVDGDLLSLSAPGIEPVAVAVNRTGARRPVDLFGAPFLGIDQGDIAAEWLSELLGARSRLVRVPPEHDRVTDGATPGTSGYADSCPVHLISTASLELLNERLTENGAVPLPMNRFRPNIVISGWEEPHVEDLARTISIGEAVLGYAKLAIRCAVTTIDQADGRRAGPEPLRTLAQYRRADDGIAFGTKFAVLQPGRLSVGDKVVVDAWGEAEI